MGRFSFALTIIFAGSLLGSTSFAYTPTVTQTGIPVRWKTPVKINLAGNPRNQNGLAESQLFDAVVRSLQRWKVASGGSADFDYWQGSDAGVYVPSSDYNGLSSLYFASQAKSGTSAIASNVLGLTQVWYNAENGEIIETDLVLNDLSYKFSFNPQDTSGYGSANVRAGSSVFIENVLTHELGHAYGLSHSGGLQSTMLFMESPEQAYLGCDDQVGIRALYPGSDAGSRGAIEGTVQLQGGSNVFGAHVVAISTSRGTVMASALSDAQGHYRITALEPGPYVLMAEPFFAGPSVLPSYYSAMTAKLCPGSKVYSRTVLAERELPRQIEAPAGGSAVAPTLTVACTDGGGAAVPSLDTSSSLGSAPVIFDGSNGASQFSVADRFESSSVLYYRLKAVSGRLELHALGYSLYSPVHPSLTVFDSSGMQVGSDRGEVAYTGRSGFINYDSALVVEGLEAGDYFVQVSASALSSSLYPAGPTSMDAVPFVLLTGTSGAATALPLSPTLTSNPRCRMTEDFPTYSSPAGGPRRSSDGDSGDSGVGFCGSISKAGGSGGDPGAGAIAGWLLPWMLMFALVRMARGGCREQSPVAPA